MNASHPSVDWSAAQADARKLVRLALDEDLAGGQDLTTNALVPADRRGVAEVVARQGGVVCGLPIGELVKQEFGGEFEWVMHREDGDPMAAGDRVATVAGVARHLLTCERTILNFLGRLSGIATQARRYADKVRHAKARVYDTRKTTPGWRRLEKYAVATGGATNHRMGLHDAVLIKDNHLVLADAGGLPLAGAVRQARAAAPGGVVVEVEVDTLEQLQLVLPAKPDVVLLDNMTPEDLQRAVAMRDDQAPEVQLEASGGVTIDTIGRIALTGVDRISVGALTHSAVSLDLGLDWRPEAS